MAWPTVNKVVAVHPIDSVQYIPPTTASELISSAATEQEVAPSSSTEHVDARASIQVISAWPTAEDVHPGPRPNQIVATPTAQYVGIRRAHDHVIARGTRFGAD